MPDDEELLTAAEDWLGYVKPPPTPGNQGEAAATTAAALASIANSLLVIARSAGRPPQPEDPGTPPSQSGQGHA